MGWNRKKNFKYLNKKQINLETHIKYEDVVTEELLQNTLDHNPHTGFLEDYRVISCLLKKYKPKTLFECGTNVGSGINVIKTALPEIKVYSLDLDYATMMQNSKQYPIGENGEDRVGSAARFVYTQLRGDSMTFDFSKYPCECYFIDSEHNFEVPYHETKTIAQLFPKVIIWHDSDIPEVWAAIRDGLKDAEFWNPEAQYDLVRVEDCRVSYALKR